MKRNLLLICLGALVSGGVMACISDDPPAESNGGAQSPLSAKIPEFEDRIELFKITKDENKNYVVYELRLAEPGRLADKPLDVYWIMAEKDGQREELNGFEEDAYGVTIDGVDDDRRELRFRVNAVEAKPMRVAVVKNAPVETYTTIDGQPAKLAGIHLLIKKTWNPLSPDITVEMTGSVEDAGEQTAVKEVFRQ